MPPIIVRDYTWNQTSKMVVVNVNIVGASIHNANLSFNDKYIKICTRQYVWELFLTNEIDCKKSNAKFGNDVVVLHLKKKYPSHWDHLEQHYQNKDLLEHRESEISRMGQVFRSTAESHVKNRQQVEADARQQYQKSIEEEEERMKLQIEKDKIETLADNCTRNSESKIATIVSNDLTPIRAFSNIKVEFSRTKNKV